MTIFDLFKGNVSKLGDSPCFRYKKDGAWRTLSWKQADGAVAVCRSWLVSLGVKAGDKVGILSPTRMEWVVADLAILSLGAVVVPIYPSVSQEQMAYIINDAGIDVLFAGSDELLRKAESLRGKASGLKHVVSLDGVCHPLNVCHPRESGGPVPATIIYTSGTTGVPKGVVITHENILAEVEGLRKIFTLEPQETMLVFLPLAHVLARAVQFFQLASGCQAAFAESMDTLSRDFIEVKPHMSVVVPRFIEKIYEKINLDLESAGPAKRKIFEWAISAGEHFGRTCKAGGNVPFWLAVRYAVARRLVFSKLHKKLGGRIRFIVSGGAPLSENLAKFFHNAGLLILEGYGLTETFAAAAVNRPGDFHFGTVGKPLPGADVKISADGEILVKGGMVFKEYFNLPEETKDAFTPDGWFKTGDIGEFSRDGFLRITDRKKDIIVTAGGKNVSPQMLESILEQSPYIRHAVVFGDRKKFISAILTLNTEMIEKFAAKHGIKYSHPSELSHNREIEALIASVVEEKNGQLSRFETIKKFAIVSHDFTVETDELTPTMKVRRRLVAEKYKDILDGFYGGL